MRFGVELEVIGQSDRAAARHLTENNIPTAAPGYSHTRMETWKAVPDSTVRRGCEIVSPVLDAREGGLDDLARVAAALRPDNGAPLFGVNSRCGFHVHVDASDLTCDDIKQIVRRYCRFEDQIDSFMAKSRRGNSNVFCRSNRMLFEQYKTVEQTFYAASNKGELAYAQRTRYMKVNVESLARHGTIEFRHHGGTINPKRIVAWTRFVLEFVAASITPTTSVLITSGIVAPTIVLRRPHGKLGRALEMMQQRLVTRGEIAAELGWNDSSIRAAVYKLRRKGFRIIRTRSLVQINCALPFMVSFYYAPREYAADSRADTTAVRETDDAATDHLFRGISQDLVDYYTNRRRFYEIRR